METQLIKLLNDIYYYYYNKYLANEILDWEWESYKHDKQNILNWLDKYKIDKEKDETKKITTKQQD